METLGWTVALILPLNMSGKDLALADGHLCSWQDAHVGKLRN